jgi:L-cysteate sulfo-lyase
MECELVLPRVVPRDNEEYEKSGNVLLDRLFGARLRLLPAEQYSEGVLESVAAELREQGRKPYVIPTGGSTAHGALGYVQALIELRAQARGKGIRVDALVVPVGSAGALAGILAGLAVTDWEVPVVAAARGLCCRWGLRAGWSTRRATGCACSAARPAMTAAGC